MQQEIDVALLRGRDEALVPRPLPLHRLREGRGDVRRAGCSSNSGSNFFSSGLVGDASPSMNFLTAALTCASSSAVGRGMVTSGGTGAGGPMTTGTGTKPPRPGRGSGWRADLPAAAAERR